MILTENPLCPSTFVPFGNKQYIRECREGEARPEFPNILKIRKQRISMINNSALQKWDRLDKKSLDQQFLNEIEEGMQCSPFEAKAILETVHKVFEPYFQNSPDLQPGQLKHTCVSINNSPGTPVSQCKMATVILTLNNGKGDLEIRKKKGVVSLRQHKIQRLCNEAFQQGAVLTVEDLAYHLLNCGVRTINRDLQQFKKEGINLPLRSIIKDIGRSLSHRSLIIKHWLKGKEYSRIARETHHSIDSVQNYVSKFKRVVSLSKENFDVNTIAYLIKMSSDLVEEYFSLFQNHEMVEERKRELEDFSKKQTQKETTA
jgi:hypothetical protein